MRGADVYSCEPTSTRQSAEPEVEVMMFTPPPSSSPTRAHAHTDADGVVVDDVLMLFCISETQTQIKFQE